jgi:hypothetical protein
MPTKKKSTEATKPAKTTKAKKPVETVEPVAASVTTIDVVGLGHFEVEAAVATAPGHVVISGDLFRSVRRRGLLAALFSAISVGLKPGRTAVVKTSDELALRTYQRVAKVPSNITVILEG